MRKATAKFLPFVQFIPMAVFLYVYKSSGDWVPAFQIGGAIAIVMLGASLFTGRVIDRVLLTINCFLLGGAAMFVFNIVWLQNLYSHFAQTTIFLWLLVIGILTTVFSPVGFIGLDGQRERKQITMHSIFLLAAVCVAIGVSLYFHDSTLRGFIVPWLAVVVFKDFLQKNYTLAGVGFAGTTVLLLMKNSGVKGGLFLWIGLKFVRGFLKSRSVS